MKIIKLNTIHQVIVDDDCFQSLDRRKWTYQKTKWGEYAARWEHGKYVYMHRLIMNAESGSYVDHINGNGLDNRKSNLRLCTNAENGRNRVKLNKNNTSGLLGVTKYKNTDRWIAQYHMNGKNHKIGIFSTKEEAGQASIMARREHYGDYSGV